MVPATGDSETDIVLKGVTRVTDLPDPSTHVSEVLSRAKKDHVVRTYGIREWTDVEDFLTKLAVKQGRLMKGGEPDMETVARVVLFDWQRGRLPYFVPPPMDGPVGEPKVIVVDKVPLALEPQRFTELEVEEAMAREVEEDYAGMGGSTTLPEGEYEEFEMEDEDGDGDGDDDEDDEEDDDGSNNNNNSNDDDEGDQDGDDDQEDWEALLDAVKRGQSFKQKRSK